MQKLASILSAVLIGLLTSSPIEAGLHVHGTAQTVKITAFGASNSVDAAYNNSRSYVTQSIGLFKSAVTLANVAQGGISAASANSADFATFAQPSYDASKTINIITLQFGGGNPGDLTSDPATVTPFYNNLVGIAQKWKALGPGTKVVIFTTWAYGCADSATVTNFTNANALIVANTTDFDVVINSASVSSVFAPSTSCPAVGISADCNHLTETGSALPVSAYIAAGNSMF